MTLHLLLLLLGACSALEVTLAPPQLVAEGGQVVLECDAGEAVDICSWSLPGDRECKGSAGGGGDECGGGRVSLEMGETGCKVGCSATIAHVPKLSLECGGQKQLVLVKNNLQRYF